MTVALAIGSVSVTSSGSLLIIRTSCLRFSPASWLACTSRSHSASRHTICESCLGRNSAQDVYHGLLRVCPQSLLQLPIHLHLIHAGENVDFDGDALVLLEERVGQEPAEILGRRTADAPLGEQHIAGDGDRAGVHRRPDFHIRQRDARQFADPRLTHDQRHQRRLRRHDGMAQLLRRSGIRRRSSPFAARKGPRWPG